MTHTLTHTHARTHGTEYGSQRLTHVADIWTLNEPRNQHAPLPHESAKLCVYVCVCVCVPNQMLLDDQIVKTQSMRASPFIKPLEAVATAWEALLVNSQDLLDNWLQVWGYDNTHIHMYTHTHTQRRRDVA